MTTQNLISAQLSSTDRAEILQKLSEIRAKLPFLITLDPDQIRGLHKASDGLRPFVEKAQAVATTNPEILPPVFPYDEFRRDCDLIDSLTPILSEFEKLTSALSDTVLAANSDALSEALEVYSAVKSHKNKVPGLDIAHDGMSPFFRRSRIRSESVTPSAEPTHASVN